MARLPAQTTFTLQEHFLTLPMHAGPRSDRDSSKCEQTIGINLRTKPACRTHSITLAMLLACAGTVHASCSNLMQSERGYEAAHRLSFPSPEQEKKFTRTLQEQAGLGLADASAFFACIKIASRRDDRDTLSQLIRYPSRTNGRTTIRTPAEFKRAYPTIFNSKVKRAIEAQRFEDLFVSYRGLMVGSGEVWISGVATNPAGKTPIKIISINNQ